MNPKTIGLKEFLRAANDNSSEEAVLTLSGSAATPKLLENLRRLDRLGLLTEEVVFSYLAQAPVDPLGIYGALRERIPDWQFQALDCTVLTILAKVKDEPVAAMRLDLMSDDIIFIARQGRKLVQVDQAPAEEVLAVMRARAATPDAVWQYFDQKIRRAVALGQKG